MKKNQVETMNKKSGTRIVCPHCGGEIYCPEHGGALKLGRTIGKDDNLGTIVLPAGAPPTAPFEFKPRHTKVDKYLDEMKAAGLDIDDYFVAPGRKGGASKIMKYDDEGIPSIVSLEEIERIIKENGLDGYVKNTRFHRRFLAMHLWKALKSEEGFNEYINNLGHQYSWKTLINELNTMAALETRDKDCFDERSRFFDHYTVEGMILDVIHKVEKRWKKVKTHKCKGQSYRTVFGKMIFESDFEGYIKKLYHYVALTNKAKSYKELKDIAIKFKEIAPKINKSIPSTAWKDEFKAAGAFYFLKNVIMYHDVFLQEEDGTRYYHSEAMAYLNEKVEEYAGQGWRLFAFMKDVIEYNDFDLVKSIKKQNEK